MPSGTTSPSPNASGSSSNISEVRTPQAGALPRKVGELEYAHSATPTRPSNADDEMEDIPIDASPSNTTPANEDAPPIPSKHKKLFDFFYCSHKSPISGYSFLGIRLFTALRFFALILTMAASIAGWVILTNHLMHLAASSDGSASPTYVAAIPINTTSTSAQSLGDAADPLSSGAQALNSTLNGTLTDSAASQLESQSGSMGMASMIFIHAAFAFLVLIQLFLFERTIWRARAEHYAFLHPEAAAAAASDGTGPRGMGIVPWTRPSLPTYAAALGHRGTGDVEDHHIAAPPPPAYGNTRGSTLLLASQLPPHLQRTRSDSRPVSYQSRIDEEDERRSHRNSIDEIVDARRARVLEETLERLDGGRSRSGVVPPPPGVLRRAHH